MSVRSDFKPTLETLEVILHILTFDYFLFVLLMLRFYFKAKLSAPWISFPYHQN